MPSNDDAPTRTRLDDAFDAWVDAHRAAIETVRTADVPRSPTDVAEGYRWVTRLASLAQNWFLEQSDPLHPTLFQLQDEHRKLLVDNPDVRYLFAVLDDSHTYRLTGTRGDAVYVGLTFGTPIGKGAVGGRTGTLTQVHLDQFDLGPDGEVDILFVPEGQLPIPKPTNMIELLPGCGQVAFRETFHDKANQRHADLRLELIDETVPPPILDGDQLAGQLEFAGLFLQFVAATAVNMWGDTATNINTFGGTDGLVHVEAQDDEVRSHSDAEMTYHGGRFVLGDGEALEVTVHEPERPFLYWGLTTASPWMESYDYRYTTTALNDRSATRNDDGSWTLVISPTDPGRTNWLDTGGRREGYMLVRWVLADGPPHPTCRIVPIG
jgi:hypothetical protein